MNPPSSVPLLAPIILLVGCSLSQPRVVAIPLGMRAVAIHSTERLQILTGDNVDIAVANQTSGRSLLVKNVTVAAVSDSRDVVTVLVSQQDSDKIMAASVKERVTVVPRRDF